MEDGRSRLKQVQQDVEEVKVIMLENLNKADERSGKLGELENRADSLLAKSKKFEKTTMKVKNQERWENMKVKVFVAVAGGILLLAVIGIIAYYLAGSEDDTTSDRSPRATLEPDGQTR